MSKGQTLCSASEDMVPRQERLQTSRYPDTVQDQELGDSHVEGEVEEVSVGGCCTDCRGTSERHQKGQAQVREPHRFSGEPDRVCLLSLELAGHKCVQTGSVSWSLYAGVAAECCIVSGQGYTWRSQLANCQLTVVLNAGQWPAGH